MAGRRWYWFSVFTVTKSHTNAQPSHHSMINAACWSNLSCSKLSKLWLTPAAITQHAGWCALISGVIHTVNHPFPFCQHFPVRQGLLFSRPLKDGTARAEIQRCYNRWSQNESLYFSIFVTPKICTTFSDVIILSLKKFQSWISYTNPLVYKAW